MSPLTGTLVVTEDEHLRDGASAALLMRERLVIDHHIGGERVERRGVGVDQHRVGGAYRFQVHGRLAGDVELVKEAREEALGAARACVGCRLVGEANLADKFGEAAGCAGGLSATLRVDADSVWRAWLAALAREEKGSRLEQISGRRCTRPHVGHQMSGVGCDICQRMAYHGGGE